MYNTPIILYVYGCAAFLTCTHYGVLIECGFEKTESKYIRPRKSQLIYIFIYNVYFYAALVDEIEKNMARVA